MRDNPFNTFSETRSTRSISRMRMRPRPCAGRPALGLCHGEPAGFRPRSLACRDELTLLGVISWLPERVAGAARRRHPHELTRYLEELAGAYLDVRETCPALPSGGMAAPRDTATASARLWLADAARTALGAGLMLLGVSAPG